MGANDEQEHRESDHLDGERLENTPRGGGQPARRQSRQSQQSRQPRSKAQRGAIVSGIIAVLCIALAFALSVWFVNSRNAAQSSQQQLVEQAQQAARQMPHGAADEAIEAAQAYNRKLAEEGQGELGSISDPYTAMKLHRVGSGAVDDGTTDADAISNAQGAASANDEEYNALLDSGGGIMGSVSIPKIGVNLPIYHGTSTSVLSSGAGHLYGTSLPAGGESSHAVITAHRGLVTAEMFTRLDEMKIGDDFSLTVLGKTLNYRVDRVQVVDPDDIEPLKIVPGEDRVTLLTCTPYGVNTQRLLVSGVRTADTATDLEAAEAPSAMMSQGNALKTALIVAGLILVLGMVYRLASAVPEVGQSRHATGHMRM